MRQGSATFEAAAVCDMIHEPAGWLVNARCNGLLLQSWNDMAHEIPRLLHVGHLLYSGVQCETSLCSDDGEQESTNFRQLTRHWIVNTVGS